MHSYIKKYFCGLIVFAIAISSFMGCKKIDLALDNAISINSIKVYDDTLAGSYGPTRIIAGAGRLYMTYVHVLPENAGTGFVGTFPRTDFTTILMSTDNEGTPLWKTAIPITEGDISGILELNNGNCLVVSLKYPAIGGVYIQFAVFDRNGQLASKDSIPFPLPLNGLFNFNLIQFTNLAKAESGNFVLYGNLLEYGIGDFGFAIGYSANANLQWAKKYSHVPLSPVLSGTFFSDCTPTPDGGYLFIGSAIADENNPDNKIMLLKINTSGDTLWQKLFDNDHMYSRLTGKIIPTANGTYLFNFNTDLTETITNISENNARTITNIYEINAMGDSVNATAVDVMNKNILYAILPNNDGSSLALLNNRSIFYTSTGGVFNQASSMHISFDSHLNMIDKGNFQTHTSDFLTSACKLPDGKTACFGVIQSYGRSYFKPELIILN